MTRSTLAVQVGAPAGRVAYHGAMTNPEDTEGAGHELVELDEASSPIEARLIAGILQGAGIPAFVAGGLLTDEFAMSQRLMNLQNVRVQVRRDHLTRAREVLAEARAAAASLPPGELERQAEAAGREDEEATDAGSTDSASEPEPRR